ncbi:MAG: AMP-binding protein, partial [Bacteroidota bacterium]
GDLRTIAPTFFTTVPRLLEKVYEAIYNKGLELTGIKRSLFFWALSLTDDYEYDKEYGGFAALKRSIADKLIFSKWREALGGNVKGIITGAAPCPAKILRVFSAAGIPVREGYGLTETSPTLTLNEYGKGMAMIGTTGPIIDGVTLLIDRSEGDYREGEGEILAIGPNVMQGYYNKPQKTAEVFKEMDGKRWFRTGDVGKFVESGGRKFLKITDRKKELLKTSGGKYVAPAPIEGKMREDFLIEQMMVVGDKRKFVSALIVPSEEALKDWCENNNVTWTGRSDAIKNDKVIARYQETINQCNPQFSHIEQVKKFRLLDAEWEPTKTDGSTAELTPTMKLKRRVILEKFADEIEEMYT